LSLNAAAAAAAGRKTDKNLQESPTMLFSRLHPSLKLPVSALLLASLCSPIFASDVVKLTGAGASFPSPLYQRWFRDYYLANKNVRVDYQAIGSGGGIANFLGNRLDFAGSDLPLTDEGAAKVEGGFIQVPMTAGAVVMTYNLPGIDGLKLSREAVTGVFLGQVKQWTDPLILAANEGVDLPDLPITLVARADSSGTTFVTTRHLSAIDKKFAKTIGGTMTPVWPKILKERGALIRGQGNGGVAAYVQAVPGAIGYVQYSYAHVTNMQMASLQNQAGEFVAPTSESFKSAVESFRAELDPLQAADPTSPEAYPILTLSWLLLRKDYDDDKAEALKKVLRYCLTTGQELAATLGYIPLNKQATDLILERVETIE
jgi:phosphate transport system substrate-binding protein